MLELYLEEMDLSEEEIGVLKQAVLDHSNGDHIESSIGLALVLADKLDVTDHRTIHSTIQDQVNLEVQKIKHVSVNISDEFLTVSYTTNEDFDIKVLVSAWNKMIVIPQRVAKYLNLNFIFLKNGQIEDWNYTNASYKSKSKIKEKC